MHDDDDESSARREYPLSTAKMSKTPSWVMLGFFLGGVTVWSVVGHLQKAQPAPRPAAKADAEPTIVRYVPQPVTTVEAVFGDWDKYAVWENDLTEVALWNQEAGTWADCYEVFRYAGRYYFRSIPTLTRRPIKRGKYLEKSPLLFTETEEQYQEWRQHGRTEQPIGDYRPLSSFSTTGGADAKSTALPRPEVVPLPPPKFEAIAPFEVGETKGKPQKE